MLGEFGFACLSTFKGVHKDRLETRKENREDRGKQFSCQCGENVLELSVIRAIHHGPY